MTYSFRKVNWHEYQTHSENKVEEYISSIKDYLKSNSLSLSDDFIYTFFFMPLSQCIFLKYLEENSLWQKSRFKNINNFLKKSKLLIPILHSKPLIASEIVSMKFFHRHPSLEHEFKKFYSYEELNVKIKGKIKVSIFSEYYKLKKYGLNNLSNEFLERLFFILLNKSFFGLNHKFPKIILGVNHGIYNLLNSFFLSLSKQNKSKLLIIQSGLFYNQIQYCAQLEYEVEISDYFLSWGRGLHQNNIKPVGCQYADRGKYEKKNSELIILPQVPFMIPRPFSSYWSHYNDFNDKESLDEFVYHLSTRFNKITNLTARCKSCDYYYYKDLFKKNSINIKIEGFDVNKGEIFHKHPITHIMSYSTAIPEAYYKGSHVNLLFSSRNILLKKKISIKLDSLLAENDNQSLIGDFLDLYSKNISSKKLAKKIGNLISIVISDNKNI